MQEKNTHPRSTSLLSGRVFRKYSESCDGKLYDIPRSKKKQNSAEAVLR